VSFSPKQRRFFADGNRRWNIKSGATRSGKTFLDYYMLPIRLRELSGKAGLAVMLGNTKGTLQRNLIEPLQSIWTSSLVSDIRSDNTSRMFGEKVYCLGADNAASVDRIRGSSWKYLYGDEWATWHPDVFSMAKSRLDKSYSLADLTNNPEGPDHWAYKFATSDVDVFFQEYCIDDNPYLAPEFVSNLKKEYAGTVYYDRFILGKWVRAEGACFPTFHYNKTSTETGNVLYELPEGNPIKRVTFGIDFGGHKSATVFVATGWFIKDAKWCIVTLDYDRIDHATKEIGPLDLNNRWFAFQARVRERWPVDRAFADSAEQILIKGLNQMPHSIHVADAMKRPITERIRAANILYASGRKFVMAHCEQLIKAIEGAVWDTKALVDTRLDNGTSDIDSLDADEYSWERNVTDLVGRL
jgi:PBSX family phage terminase large subunit